MSTNIQRRIKKIEKNLKPRAKRIEDIIMQIDLEKRIDTLSPQEHERLAELKSRPIDPAVEKTLNDLEKKHRENSTSIN